MSGVKPGDALANLAAQQNAMAANLQESGGFVGATPELLLQNSGVRPDLLMGNQPGMNAEAKNFMNNFAEGPMHPGMQFAQHMPPQIHPAASLAQVHRPAMARAHSQVSPNNLAAEFARMNVAQGDPWASEFMKQAGPAPSMYRPQMMAPQMGMGPQQQAMHMQQMHQAQMQQNMMYQSMMQQMAMSGGMMQQPVSAPQQPLQQTGAQKTVETIEEVTPQSTQQQGGIPAVEQLANHPDPKFRNSKFLQFLNKVQDGRIQFTDDNGLVETPTAVTTAPEPQTAAEPETAEEWAQQFMSMQEGGTEEEQAFWKQWQDQLSNARAEAAQAMQPPADPEYAFAAENKFLEAKDPFGEGVALFNAGRLKEAIAAFEAAVQKDTNHAEAWRYLGQANAENEAEAGAIAALLKCIELDPYNLDALLMLGVSYTNDLEEARALKYLKTWLLNNPDYQAEMNANDVNEYEELYANNTVGVDVNLHQQVTNMFLRAVTINPRDADLHVVLGVLYHITNDWPKAIGAFQNAVKLRPDDPQLWNKLGATQANSSRSVDAMHAYKRALEIRPTFVRALANLAISFANQGLHDQAVRTYLATLERNPNANHIWQYLRLSLSHLGRDDLTALVSQRNVDVFREHYDF
jgi:peroxin-5